MNKKVLMENSNRETKEFGKRRNDLRNIELKGNLNG